MNWWSVFVARRFLSQRNRRGEGIITLLPIIGIALGIITLVTVIGIMNGFQLGFIENILEVFSYHGQLYVKPNEIEKLEKLLDNAPHVTSYTMFKESFSLLQSDTRRIEGAIIRGMDFSMAEKDINYIKRVDVMYGNFPVGPDDLLIGTHLARRLGVMPGDSLLITGTGQSRQSTILMPIQKRFVVSGIFETGYFQYDSNLIFIPLGSFNGLFPQIEDVTFGIKLETPGKINNFAAWWSINGINSIPFKSWKDLNKSFFSALAIEKLLMVLVISLIFLVVCINLYHSIRRSILERKEELSTLKALGAETKHLRNIIMLEGSIIGLAGACLGAPFSLLLVENVNAFLSSIESLLYWFFSIIELIVPRADFSLHMMFFSSYPIRVLPHEYILTLAFGLIAPVIGAYIASKDVVSLYPVEVLHYE